MNKAILIGLQRSGTGYVRAWLNNFPDVDFHSELFLQKNVQPSSFMSYLNNRSWRKVLFDLCQYKKFPKISNNPITSKLVQEFLEEVFTAATFPKAWQNQKDAHEYAPRILSDYSLVGLKGMYGQMKYNTGLLRYIKRNDVKVLHLYRKNILALLVSRELKKITGIAHSTGIGDIVKAQQVFLDPATIVQVLNSIQNGVKKWDDKFIEKNYLKISFEEFLVDQTTRETVLKFLNLPLTRAGQESAMKKTNQQTLSDSISNFDEISNRLIDTPFAFCLDS